MENKEFLAAERHSNIEMLSTLLEKVKIYDALVAKREALRQRLQNLDQKLATPAPKLKVLLIVIFAIIAVALYFVLKDFVVPVITLVVGLVIAIVPFVVKKNKWKKFIAETQAERDATQIEFDEAVKAVQEYLDTELNPYLETIIPERFSAVYCMNAAAIEAMLYLLVNLRADTIKETINLYETLIFRGNLEANLNEIKRYTASTARSAERSAVANEKAAASAAITAAATTATAASMASVASAANRAAAASERAARAAERPIDVKVDVHHY